jgi:hypothetical protein
MLAADHVALWSHHAGTQLMEDDESRLVAAQSKLTLELQRRLAWRLRRHQIGAPEPHRQRRVAGLHDRPRRKRGILLAPFAAEDDRRTCLEAVRFVLQPAASANEAIGPADGLQMGGTGRIIREYPLKFGESRRKAAYVYKNYTRSSWFCHGTG